MRRTKIVCTIGPASNSEEMIRTTHEGGHECRSPELFAWHVRRTCRHDRAHSAHLCASRLRGGYYAGPAGPKIRTGALQDGQPVRLVDGSELTITTHPLVGMPAQFDNLSALPQDVKVGDRILLDDGLMELRVLGSDETEVQCQVVHGGLLKEHKGINLPGVAVSASALTEKDRDDLRFGVQHEVDYVALSFVRKPEDILEAKQLIRQLLEEQLDSSKREAGIPLIAKLEKPEAVAHLEEILKVTDGVMVARGDLGVEMAPEKVPLIRNASSPNATSWVCR